MILNLETKKTKILKVIRQTMDIGYYSILTQKVKIFCC